MSLDVREEDLTLTAGGHRQDIARLEQADRSDGRVGRQGRHGWRPRQEGDHAM
jgi:hypothetical protein